MIDQKQLEEPLILDHQHKMEWKTLAEVEAESWHALDQQQQLVIMHLRSAKAPWEQQIKVLKEQLLDIQCLHQANQQKRALLQQDQLMAQKINSTDPVDASPKRSSK